MSKLSEARAAAATARADYESVANGEAVALFDGDYDDCARLWFIAAEFWGSAAALGRLGNVEAQAQFAGYAQDAESAAQDCDDAGGKIIELG